jgi:acyl-CoA thioesterase
MRHMPFNNMLGVRVLRKHNDGVTIGCELRDDLRNGAGVLHGGVTATLADVAVGFAVANHFGATRRATTVELKINYLRPIAHGRINARARLLRVGSNLVVGSVDIKDSAGKLAASALVTYMLLPQ